LIQVDVDGKQKVYDPIYTNCSKSEHEMEIYPNPAQGDFVISLSALDSEKITIEFVNANGMLVLSKECEASNGMNHYNFNSQEFVSGLYYVRIVSTDNQTIKKLIVQ
jgi:hypothetical protein